MKTRLFLMLLFVSSFAFAQFPTSGLVAQYGFDNGSLADGASGNNFTQIGTTLSNTNDRFNTSNNAININSDYLTASNVTTGTKLSVSFWVKTSTTGTKVILNDADGITSSLAGYEIYMQNGLLKVRFGMNHTCYPALDQSRIATSTKNIADGNWHHIVMTLEYKVFPSSGNVQALLCYIYMDNLPGHQGTNSISGLPASCIVTQNIDTTGNLSLANDRGQTLGNGNRYGDTIDDILIYNRLLTSAERQSIATYNGYCFAPETSLFSAVVTSNTTGTVSISGSGTFDIAYHKTSEPFSNVTIVTGVNSGSTTLTGLNESTSYDVYIREQCASIGTATGWSASRNFRTLGKIFVNLNATGANDGSSFADAFTDLQDALAISQSDGQEIWIAAGTYNPHASNRSTYYVINKENMKIYGGFTGTETQLSDRVIGANETILSADLQANDVNITDYLGNYSNATRTDNSYHVIYVTGNNLLLDGLTISDAHNNQSGTSSVGAAILKHKTIPYLTIKNCVIKDNVARNANAGLMAEFELTAAVNGTGALVVENSKFINNMSRGASGIYSIVRAYNNVDITVTNTLFDGNIVGNLNSTNAQGSSGSASWFRSIAQGSHVTLNLTNNTYVNNIDLGTDQSLNNFSRGTVTISRQSGISGFFNANVSNCIFLNNTAAGGATTRSITDSWKFPISSLIVRNSLDPLNFNDDSITSKVNTINADPLFTNAANNDFTLTASSPAINTGDNSYVTTAFDLAGNQRIFNSTVDMGCYESAFYIATYELTTNVIGSGSVSPSGITTHNDGAIVSVVATPVAGWSFDGWSGASTSVNSSISITMDTDKTLTAIFSQIQYELTIIENDGTVTPDSGTLANGVYTYNDGTVVEITAVANTGFVFDYYEITDSNGITNSSTNPLSITMTENMIVEAIFTSTAGINDNINLDFIVFPNPVSNLLNIQLNEEINNIEIFNLIGQKIIESNTKQINVSNLENGVYLIKVNTISNKSVTKRFVKK